MKKTILILLLLFSTVSLSCAGKKIHYFNDSDKVYAGEKGDNVIAQYPYVIMSKGKFREVTTVTLESGNYICNKIDK